MEAIKKKHTPVEARRKDKISAETGTRKDIKKAGAGGKGVLGKFVRAASHASGRLARPRKVSADNLLLRPMFPREGRRVDVRHGQGRHRRPELQL